MCSSGNKEDDINNINMVTNRATYNPKRSPSRCFLNCSLSSIQTPPRDSRLSTPIPSAKIEDFFLKQIHNHTIPEHYENTVKVKGFYLEEEDSKPDKKQELEKNKIQPTQSHTLLSNILKKRITTAERPKQRLLIPLLRLSLGEYVIAEVNSQQSDIDMTIAFGERQRISISTDIDSDLSSRDQL